LSQARAASKLVFVDFFAEWCAPCKIIESKTLPDSRVQEALEGFVFVRVDADADQGAGARFGVFGMPTLLVLGVDGDELFRHVGPIEPADLAEKLLQTLASAAK
jgi:thiol:disulfide interchange protein DsbD